MNSGRKFDVMIVDEYMTEKSTGLKQRLHSFTVWADEGLNKAIEGVDGVTNAYNSISPTRYSVYIDKRYDLDIVKENIEKALLSVL